MEYVLSAKEMAEADRRTSEVIGLPSLVLMERAALSVAQEIMRRFPAGTRVVIAAGRGNNGADGVAAGRILQEAGYRVRCCILPGEIREGSAMQTQLRVLHREEGDPLQYPYGRELLREPDFGEAQVIVDALFGTGLSRDIVGDPAGWIREINNCSKKGALVVSVDLPSGISADDGHVCGCAVRADLTVTFAYHKRGHYFYPGAELCGEVCCHPISITDRSLAHEPGMWAFTEERPGELLPVRDPSGNKGTFGKVLLVCGSRGMCGAALMAARACLRSGAGMVKVFTSEANRVIVQGAVPEALLTTYEEDEDTQSVEKKLLSDLAWAQTCACGSGLGRSARARDLVTVLLRAAADPAGPCRSLVLDADALRIIAADGELERLLSRHRQELAVVLTPHLGEFADLCHLSIPEAGARREELLHGLCERTNSVAVCKDARTLVGRPGVQSLFLNTAGNSGMATAGSGDVLTGICAGVLAQCREAGQESALHLVECAVRIHALAGDAARDALGERSMSAMDLCDALPKVLK